MRFVIKHEIKGRLRVHILQSRMSFAQADTLQYYLDGQNNIVSAKIQERTLDVTVVYTGSREEALKTLENFTYQGTEVPENYLANSGREMNREYKDQLINNALWDQAVFTHGYPFRDHHGKIFQISLAWNQDPGKGQDRSTGTGCHCYRCICAAR